jgi:hypothetical protein
VDRQVDHCVLEAAHAWTVKPGVEAQLERRPARTAADHEFGRHRLRHREVALAAEVERRELDVLLVAVLLARAELGLSEVEKRHLRPG